MKLNIYGHQPIIAPRDPVLPMEVTPKAYVDALVLSHASDFSLHLTPAQNALLDAITVTAEEINSLAGSSGNSLQSQINNKINRSGDVMSGALTLYGTPTENLHAAPKSYVDTEAAKRVALAGGIMSGFLTLHAVPTANLHAAPKQYVDSSIVAHANNTDLHLTTEQNLWIDSITATSSEVNQLVGVSAPIQTQLDSKLSNLGGEVSGDIVLTSNATIHVNKTFTGDTELVNKAYVDARVRGQEWRDPVSTIDLLSFNETGLNELGEPITYTVGGVYIIGQNPVRAQFVGFEGYLVVYREDDTFSFMQNRPVQPGDRFGINLDGAFLVRSHLQGIEGSVITITSVLNGVIQYTVDPKSPGSTVLIFDQEDPRFGQTWTYTEEGQWILTNTSTNLTTGQGLLTSGNTIAVNKGAGLTFVEDTLVVKLSDQDSAIQFGGQSEVVLVLAEQGGLTQSQESPEVYGLRLNENTINNINDRLSKSQGGIIVGDVSVDVTGSLSLAFTPIDPAHAVTKNYVDQADGNIQGQVTTLQGKVSTLEVDPTSKSYVDAQVGTKVSKAGDSMSGFLTLHANPLNSFHAATKQYVDSTITSHVNNNALHLTALQNTWLDAITASSQEVNHLVGVDENIQLQLDSKVNKAGDVMAGPLVLAAAPVNDLEATTKNYVDSADALKVNKAGDTLTGPLVLAGSPTENLHAAPKQYVDSSTAAAVTSLTTQINTKVSKAGDTMTGPLTLSGTPSNPQHAAPKQYIDDAHTSLKSYVDSADVALQGQVTTLQGKVTVLETDPTTKTYVNDGLATKVSKAGDFLSGYLTLHADPQQAMHAVTKQYVDAVAQGLSIRPAVRLATTTNIAANYSNGTQGVNATLTGTTNGAIIVDSITPMVGDRVLIKDQVLKAQNGDYVVQQVGNASTPFILRRVITLDESHEVAGSYFYVFDGLNQKGTGWSFIVDNPVTFAIGTDDINVFQFSGQGNLIAGAGMTITGNTIDINTANSGRIVINPDSIDLATTGVVPGTYTRFTVDGYGRVLAATSPTTLAGYGISDAQSLNANLTSLSAVSSNGILVRDSGNQLATRIFEVQGIGLSITNPAGGSTGNIIIASNATSVADVSTVVARDASGNFAANIITAALSGNASTATALQNSRGFSATGDATAEAVPFNGTNNVNLNLVLANTGVTAGEYTKVTVDAKGRITVGSNPNTVAGMGLIDAATIEFVNNKFTELEEKFNQLHLYVMGRI